MHIKKLTLTNFRNYKSESVTLEDGLNVIFGGNAEGKTNMLEAVYFSGLGKTERTSKDKDLILWGEDSATIKLEVEKRFRQHVLEIHIDSKGKKRIQINKIPVARLGDLIGFLNVIYFSPEELKMIKEAPSERRRFMDITLSQQKKSYFYALTRYNKILAQRNKSIKSYKDTAALKSILPVWDAQLAKEGAIIIKNRYDFIKRLTPEAEIKHTFLSGGKEKISLQYESLTPDTDTADIEKLLLELLYKNCDRDIYLGYTSCGPQRDDIDIKINGIDVKKFGSQGQQRTSALSLKLAETAIFEQETGEKPIILLDDVLSELDENRQRELIRACADCQTLLTCTSFDGDKNAVKKFIEIEKGKVIV